MIKFLKKLFKKHRSKIVLIRRCVLFFEDVKHFFINYRQKLIDAGLETDVDELAGKLADITEDIKNTFKIY